MVAACRLCRSARGRRIFEKDGALYHRCRDCGLVFAVSGLNPNLENELEDYEPSYLDYLRETPEDEAQFRSLRRWMEGFGPLRATRLLDVGAGSGKWVRHLRQRGVEACGVEPASALYRHFLAQDPFFSCDSVERFAAQRPGGFDCVTAFDVLEHVADPPPFFAALALALRPGGKLFLSTPDVSSWLARLAGRRWHYFNKYHLCLFDARTLEAAARPHGLRLLRRARRGRTKSLRYLCGYCSDFVLRRRSLRAPERLQNLVIPVNLFDTLDACFEKESAAVASSRS